MADSDVDTSRSTGVPIALQLYTVRDRTAEDFAGTVRQVAQMGYDAVEFAGYGGLSAEEVAALLAETGLRAASTHLGFDALRTDLEAQIHFCRSIGCTNLVLAYIPRDWQTAESLEALTELLNDVGRRCREQGLTFGYHNHDFEFATIDGKTMLERMMEGTDPLLVGFELDVYWAAHAGVEPRRFLGDHADRIPLLHLKDMAADGSWTEVGEGTLNLRAMYAAAGALGVQWCFVENDAPSMPSLESARRSLQNLRSWEKA